jgi:hypothetical protein
VPKTAARRQIHPRHADKLIGFARISTALFVLLSIASIAAIWSILSLISGGYGGYMAPIVALCIVLMLHSFGYAPGWQRGFMAAVLMALSVGYQGYLFAAGTIAGEMGFSLGESVKMIGLELAFAIIRAHVTEVELVCYLASLLFALILGLLLGRGAKFVNSSQRI